MIQNSYRKFKMLRESKEEKDNSSGPGGVGSKISLGDGNDFVPFEISDDPKSEHYGKNKNLSPIVRAFKNGANWGWSRDDSTGSDKPVKITGKKLFLAGGAVRDHLKGKKPRNIELATNASPDEVYHLLKQNGFEFISNDGETKSGEKTSPNKKEGDKQFFWVKKGNKNGRPFVFGIRVNQDEYELEVFMKTPRGTDAEPEPGTQAEDAAGRDFTINGMYIGLTNDNGPNKELYDYHGGVHHLTAGRINSIGDMKAKLKEDPTRILRYIRMLTSYGDPKKVPEEEKDIIRKSADGLGKIDRKKIMGEFKKGLDKDDVDPRDYLNQFRDFGLLGMLFPGKQIDSELPKELSELGDKHMPLAWMLRGNSPDSLSDTGLDPNDLQKISFLIKSLGVSESTSPEELSELITGYMTSGVTGRKLREWGVKIGKIDGSLIDAFVNYAKSPRVRTHTRNESGAEVVSDNFIDLFDQFTGRQDVSRVEERRRQLEHQNFLKFIEKSMPARVKPGEGA